MTKKKMGLGKLSDFSGIKSEPDQETPPTEAPPTETSPPSPLLEQPKAKKKPKRKKENTVKINIKIEEKQKEWLAKTATKVRNNNSEPVPPADRVFPQHLIGVAIDLLKSQELDWSQIQNIEELREHLNLE